MSLVGLAEYTMASEGLFVRQRAEAWSNGTQRLTDAFKAAATSERGAQILEKSNHYADFMNKTLRGNMIASALVGAGKGIFAYSSGEDGLESVKIGLNEAVPFSEAAVHYYEGDSKAAIKSAAADGAGVLGTMGGVAAGAAIGSVVPVVGTAVGALAGGIVCSLTAEAGTEWLLDSNPYLVETAESCVNGCVGLSGDFARSAYDTISTHMSEAGAHLSSIFTMPLQLFPQVSFASPALAAG